MEAVLLDLSILHCSEGRTIAGDRLQLWGAVMRDHKTICENVYSCAALMMSIRIQLYEVSVTFSLCFDVSIWLDQGRP